MSYSLEFDDGSEAIEVGSSRGWPQFSDWATSLPDEDYPDLIHLCNFGWVQGPYVVAGQIAHALRVIRPKDDSVAKTAAGVIEALKGRDDDATVLVVNTLSDSGGDGKADVDEPETKADDTSEALALIRRVVQLSDGILSEAPDSDDDRRALCHAVSGLVAGMLRESAEALLAEISPNGKTAEHPLESKAISDAIGKFFSAALKAIRTGALAATLALRGPEELAPPDRTILAAQVVKQEAYLKDFEAAVRDGSQPPDGTLAGRAEMYGRAAWTMAHAVEKAVAVRDGKMEARSVLGGSEESCEGCMVEARKGWVDVADIKAVGDRDCLTRCLCHIEFR